MRSFASPGWSRWVWWLVAALPAVLVAVPLAMVLGGILQPNTEVWSEQWNSRLPGEIVSSVVLLVGVVAVTVPVGTLLAWLVGAHDFPGRWIVSWALVLPLAIPGYILGFLATSVLGVAGPVQTRWRDVLGAEAWFPDIRTMPFAIAVLSLTLYPYVYLLVRAALHEQAAASFEVARTLGSGRWDAFRRVVLPSVRPAIAAGGAIVAMETLTDFATVQYFGVDTVTVGIFRIWRGSYDRDAAAEIAALVLGFAVVVIVAERILRGRARFGAVGGRSRTFTRHRLTGWKGVAALAASGSIVAIAFVLPVAQLTAWAVAEQRGPRGTPQLEKFTELLGNSLTLTAITTGLCLLVGLVVTNADRFAPSRFGDATRRITTFGYAVPGPVVAMGMVLGLVALDDALERIGGDLPGTIATGSLLGLVLAYMVRFFAPAVNATESGLEQVSGDLTAAARTLGHRPLSILGRVHLPLTWASVVAAAVLVGVDALKELPVALLLRPIGFDTLPIWVFGLATESRFQQAALPALSIIAVATLPVIIIARHLDTPRR